jgi:hypothetical protein
MFCFFISEASTLNTDSPKKEYLKLIKNNFPNYILLRIDDLNSFTKPYFKEHYSGLNPSLIHLDFNGDGHLDYAFLLRNKDSKDAKTIFAVFLNNGKGNYELIHQRKDDIYRDDTFIVPIKAGKIITETDSIDKKEPLKKVVLNNYSIEYNVLGKGIVIFYWDEIVKKISSITTFE